MTEPIITITNLYHAYEEGLPAIHDVMLEVESGSFIGIIGHNGAGKTTLVKHLNGLLKPTSGQVLVAGMDTRNTSVAQLAHRVGFIFQNPDHQIFSATVLEEVAFGPKNLGYNQQQAAERAHQALADLNLTHLADTPPAMLGYGLRRKVSLAAVLAMEPDILVLDEPTVGLDARSTNELFAHIVQLHRLGHTILLVTHDMRLVTRFCAQSLVLREGRVAAYDETRVIFADAELVRSAGLAQPPITRLGTSLADLGLPTDILSVQEFVAAYQRISGSTG